MATNSVASIVLPYRNSVRTLERCLVSIIGQTFRNWELIAVNDCSKDNSLQVLESFQKIDNRIKSFNSPGKGIVDALNFGISSAKSEIIIRMDSDDEMQPDRIKEQVEFLNVNSSVGLISSKVLYKADNTKGFNGKGYSLYVDWINQILSHNEIKLHRFEESPFAHPSVTFRRTLIHKYGAYREGNFPEDYELWLRWLSNGVKMEKLRSNLLTWYDSPQRLSRIGTCYSEDAFQQVKAAYLSKWLKEQNLLKKKISGWGLGKVAKKQIKHLQSQHINFSRFYEVDPAKVGNFYQGSPIVSFNEISLDQEEFILVLTGSRGAKEKIHKFLTGKSLSLGADYLFIS